METKINARKPLSDEILTAEEVANFLRIHPSIIYRLAKRGDLPDFRVGVGGDWRFSRASSEQWLESRKQKG
jgi:excisionase family DNA binding protein